MAWWNYGESFYTDAKGYEVDDCLVDMLYIDTKHKQFCVAECVSDMNTDGCDESGEEYCSLYVSREVFDMLVEAVKLHGYQEKK